MSVCGDGKVETQELEGRWWPRYPHLSHNGGREGAIVIDPVIDAGLCGPHAAGFCAIGKGQSLLEDGEGEAGPGLPLPVLPLLGLTLAGR